MATTTIAYEGAWQPRRGIQVPVPHPVPPIQWTEFDEARQLDHARRGREELAEWTRRREQDRAQRLAELVARRQRLLEELQSLDTVIETLGRPPWAEDTAAAVA